MSIFKTYFPSPYGIRKHILLPVIHPISRDAACRGLDVARECGADGAFLINQGMPASAVEAVRREWTRRNPGFWVGVNYLGSNVQTVVCDWNENPHLPAPAGIWSDRADPLRSRGKWQGLYFGGVSFKHQEEVMPEDERRAIGEALVGFVDVVTTSGVATGSPADLSKIRRFREILEELPLAVASGITPENVGAYLPYVDAYLVATGIEWDFGVLDPEKVRRLADLIHGAG